MVKRHEWLHTIGSDALNDAAIMVDCLMIELADTGLYSAPLYG